MASPLGWSLKPRQEHLTLAFAGAVLCGAALLPLIAVIAGAPLSGLAPLASATPWLLLLRTCLLAATVTACALVLGVPLGLLFGRADVPGRRAALLIHALPAFLPPFLLALGWFHLFVFLGGAGNLFNDAGAIAIEAVAFAPIVTTLVAMGVQAIDPSLEEAGRLTAPPWKVILRIVLPIAWPATALAALLVFALSLSELGVPMFLRVRSYGGPSPCSGCGAMSGLRSGSVASAGPRQWRAGQRSRCPRFRLRDWHGAPFRATVSHRLATGSVRECRTVSFRERSRRPF